MGRQEPRHKRAACLNEAQRERIYGDSSGYGRAEYAIARRHAALDLGDWPGPAADAGTWRGTRQQGAGRRTRSRCAGARLARTDGHDGADQPVAAFPDARRAGAGGQEGQEVRRPRMAAAPDVRSYPAKLSAAGRAHAEERRSRRRRGRGAEGEAALRHPLDGRGAQPVQLRFHQSRSPEKDDGHRRSTCCATCVRAS
jgi:hypothetical protein